MFASIFYTRKTPAQQSTRLSLYKLKVAKPQVSTDARHIDISRTGGGVLWKSKGCAVQELEAGWGRISQYLSM
jgi:hypothetical protein